MGQERVVMNINMVVVLSGCSYKKMHVNGHFAGPKESARYNEVVILMR